MFRDAVRLAQYTARLGYEDLRPEVVQRAKDCITHMAAVIVRGQQKGCAMSAPVAHQRDKCVPHLIRI
jgi:hypothetical protein